VPLLSHFTFSNQIAKHHKERILHFSGAKTSLAKFGNVILKIKKYIFDTEFII